MSRKADTKAKILEATARIINEEGVFSLTLEAVAKVAGVSKGGLLYHFPSKESLLEGMVNYLTQNFVTSMNATVKEDAVEIGKWTRAYTNLTFNQEKEDVDMNTAFLAAVATNPELLKPMAEGFQELYSHIENDGIDSTIATIVRLAVDGVYFNQLFGMQLEDDTRKRVLEHLISLTEENQ